MLNYDMAVNVIIDTNTDGRELRNNLPALRVEVKSHPRLDHPFNLTFCHRAHMANHIEDYDYFMYSEDDMLLPWEGFKHYIEVFDKMWPQYVPGLVRVETGPDGKLYNTDATERGGGLSCVIDGTLYHNMKFPYHAQWIMPQEALKSSMRGNFVRLDTNRELAASYPMWELLKTPLVKLTDKGQVDSVCYTYHLANNYAMSPDSPFGKIEIDKILI